MWNSKSSRIVLIVSATILVLLLIYAFGRDSAKPLPLQQLQQLVETNAVKKVLATPEYLYVKTSDACYKIATSQVDPHLIADYPVEVGSTTSPVTLLLIVVILFAAAGGSYWFWKYKLRRSSATAPTPSSGTAPTEMCRPVTAQHSNVRFKDIGGIAEVKVELEEIIDFLKHPQRYHRFGARLPRGVLLVGPPGVGKTMIAKAVAAEADVPFYYQSGASFVQIYVGMGAKRVNELFRAAKANAPAIIFIDEIDAVGKKRDGNRNDEREATLNQLLTEMDGFEDTSGVIVVAATNNIDVLDSALLRAGRFDRRIFVELPTLKERESILSKYLKHIPHSVDIEAIAKMTVGFNGASLAAMVNEAALLSLREKQMQVITEHFEAVRDKVLLGKKKMPVLTEEQKAFKARYEAGKAVAALHWGIAFEKVALTGETIRLVTSTLILKHEFENGIRLLLSGMVSCELTFGEHAVHVAEDLAEAKALIEAMVERYGMGTSKRTGEEEQRKLFEKLNSDVREILKTKESLIEAITLELMERESISEEEVARIVDNIL